MTQCYGGCNLVHVLSARPARPRKGFLKIDISDAEPRHALNKGIFGHCYPGFSWLSTIRIPQLKMPMAGLEPARAFYGPTDFKSVASAISPHRRRFPGV